MFQASILSSLPRVRHGFFGRKGGVSRGIFTSLNCGPGSGDDGALVAENRRIALDRIGLPAESMATLHQVHSADAVLVREPWESGQAPKADAMVSDRPGVALGILTADCAPVLFADADACVVGAAHAGWKGALGGVVEATLEAMEKLGAARENIRVAVGPCIGPDSYEVGPDLLLAVVGDDGTARRFFRPGGGDRHFFDLPGYVMARATAAGVGQVVATGHDTLADADAFFSYRRSCHRGDGDYGRQLSIIAIVG